MTPTERGRRRPCGVDPADWKRLHNHEIGDAHNTFITLQRELIRHHFLYGNGRNCCAACP